MLFSSSTQRYIDFIGINIDAGNSKYGGIKIEGWSGGNPHHIRFRNLKVLGSTIAPGQGIVCDAQVPGIIGGNEFLSVWISRVLGDDFCHGIYIKSGGNRMDLCNIYEVPGACIHLYATYP